MAWRSAPASGSSSASDVKPGSRRLTIGVLSVFVLVGLALYLIPNPFGLLKYEEETACRTKCEALKKSWRLVPARSLPSAPGRYEGPRNCECY